MLGGIICIFWIGLECDLSGTESTLDVEAEDLDAVVVLAFNGFLACIELLALINIFPTSIATPSQETSLEYELDDFSDKTLLTSKKGP